MSVPVARPAGQGTVVGDAGSFSVALDALGCTGVRRGVVSEATWGEYLGRFHDQRPGITSAVLSAAGHRGLDPYRWMVHGLVPRGLVVDVACGDAPLYSLLRDAPYVGLDVSEAELVAAAGRGASPLLRTDATQLPLLSSAASAVVCSMSLQIMQPLHLALAEVHRILVPGGRFVALVPGTGPLQLRDQLRYLRLRIALRVSLGYPNDLALADPGPLFAEAGLDLVEDEQRRFVIAVDDRAAAGMFIRSLYLPGVPAGRVAGASRVARRWVGSDLGVPLRRLVAVRRE